MTTDFRALCVELTDCLEKADWPHRYKVVFQQWTDIARAALSEPKPEPEGPTLAEVDALCAEHSFFYEDSESLECLLLIITDALARWGRSDGPAVPEGREPAFVVTQPSDEEIMELMPPQMHEDFAFAARAMANEAGTDSQKAKGFMRIALNRHAVDLALAVLARFGNHFPDAKKMVRPAPAPAEGEVE